jgi:hypothetical protein
MLLFSFKRPNPFLDDKDTDGMMQHPRTFLALLLSATAALAAEEPGPLYRAGKMGLLYLKAEGPRWVGKYLGAGECAFAADEPVLEGELFGNIFLGTVLLCQEGGDACPTRRYPVLALRHEQDLSFLADVRLSKGCASLALDEGRLRVWPATEEERKAVGTGRVSGLAPSQGKTRATRRALEQHRRFFLLAQEKLKQKDFEGAQSQFEESLHFFENSPAAHRGMGVAAFNRGNLLNALHHLSLARTLWSTPRQDVYEVDFQLACVHALLMDKEAALLRLRLAAKGGFRLPPKEVPASLGALLGEAPELQAITRPSSVAKRSRRRR